MESSGDCARATLRPKLGASGVFSIAGVALIAWQNVAILVVQNDDSGWVAEWTKAAVLKTAVRVTVPGVRIPPHPFVDRASNGIQRNLREKQACFHGSADGLSHCYPQLPLLCTSDFAACCGRALQCGPPRRRELTQSHQGTIARTESRLCLC